MTRKLLILFALWLGILGGLDYLLATTTWGTFNGITVGTSAGNVSKFNGGTIGTTAGNIGSFNGLASPGGAVSAALVQSVGFTNTTHVGITITISSTGSGNFLALFINKSNTSTLTVTDNKGGGTSTYTSAYDIVGGGSTRQQVFYTANIGSGITQVYIAMGTAIGIWGDVREYSGMALTSPVDVQVASLNLQGYVATNAPVANALVTNVKDVVLVGCYETSSSTSGYADRSPWVRGTRGTQAFDGDDSYTADQLNLASGTYTGTITSNGSYIDICGAIAFKTQ